MERSKYIEIKLKSDLCASSGYAFAGIIDSDICYDEYGIPYIPGRRIKGCMKEAAESTLHSLPDIQKSLEQIFGRRGQRDASSLYVENAYIKDYEAIRRELAGAFQKNEYENIVTTQSVLEQFTHVQAQTKINASGTAEENSLRFTRVVNQYSPLDQKELVFYARITYEAPFDETIEKIVKATRNIGLKRNRGLGCVECSLKSVEEIFPDGIQKPEISKEGPITEDDKCVIYYMIQNEAPLVLSNDEDNATSKYINGSSILGSMAGQYLKNDGKEDSEEFRDLFLNGTTKYTNAYICDPEEIFFANDWHVENAYIPAPEYLTKTKKSGRLFNLFRLQDGKESTEPGDQPKKMKGKYVCIHPAQKASEEDLTQPVSVLEPELQVVYHHTSVDNSKGGKTPDLYSHEALMANQYFFGQIYTKGEYLDQLEKLLECLRLGKSKTAQYGKCRLVRAYVVKEKQEKVTFEKGDFITVTLLSDAIFAGETGYTVYSDEVRAILAAALGIPQAESAPTEAKDHQVSYYDILQTKIIYGYNSKWNLRKSPVPVIQAGSCFVFRLEENASISNQTLFVGSRNQEGFGLVCVQKLDTEKFSLAQKETDRSDESELSLAKKLVDNLILLHEVNEPEKPLKLNITASTLGRVTLMLRESIAEYPDDAEKAFSNFGVRVESIKREGTRSEVKKEILKKYGTSKKIDAKVGDAMVFVVMKNDEKQYWKWELNPGQKDTWEQKLKRQLTEKKYALKNEKKKEGAFGNVSEDNE